MAHPRGADPRRLRLIFIDDADNLANATSRARGIVLARMRQIAEEANVAFVLVGTSVLETLLGSLPHATTRFRIMRYPAGVGVRNASAAPWSGLADPEGHDGTGTDDEPHPPRLGPFP